MQLLLKCESIKVSWCFHISMHMSIPSEALMDWFIVHVWYICCYSSCCCTCNIAYFVYSRLAQDKIILTFMYVTSQKMIFSDIRATDFWFLTNLSEWMPLYFRNIFHIQRQEKIRRNFKYLYSSVFLIKQMNNFFSFDIKVSNGLKKMVFSE